MKTYLSKIVGATVLSKENQRKIRGNARVDISLCGCSCSGSVTGPKYCELHISCPQVYTC